MIHVSNIFDSLVMPLSQTTFVDQSWVFQKDGSVIAHIMTSPALTSWTIIILYMYYLKVGGESNTEVCPPCVLSSKLMIVTNFTLGNVRQH